MATLSRFFWIASYPKSGNTWLRFLVTNLLRGPVRTSGEIEAFIPDMHRGGLAEIPPVYRDAMFYKIHLAASRLDGMLERSAGAVYIVRNPFGVCCSGLDYLQIAGAARPAALHHFIAEGGFPRWIGQGMGSWSGNVLSWLDPALSLPRLLLRYEDLAAEPHAAVSALCRFLGLAVAAEAIARTVDRSSFAALRGMEDAELRQSTRGLFVRDPPRSTDPRWRFISRGPARRYSDVLRRAEIDAIAAAFAPAMEILGYGLDAAGELVVRPDFPARTLLPATPAF